MNVNVPVLRSDRKTFAPPVVVTKRVFDTLVRKGVTLEPIVLFDVRLRFSVCKPVDAAAPVSVRAAPVDVLIRLTKPGDVRLIEAATLMPKPVIVTGVLVVSIVPCTFICVGDVMVMVPEPVVVHGPIFRGRIAFLSSIAMFPPEVLREAEAVAMTPDPLVMIEPGPVVVSVRAPPEMVFSKVMLFGPLPTVLIFIKPPETAPLRSILPSPTPVVAIFKVPLMPTAAPEFVT